MWYISSMNTITTTSRRATINTRIDGRVKKSAEAVFKKVGISMSDAVSLFMTQVSLQQGLPFAVSIPNAATQRAMREVDEGKAEMWTGSTADFMKKYA
jgi:DNA-damage-inducible protein J